MITSSKPRPMGSAKRSILWRKLRRSPLALCCILFLVTITLFAIFAPQLSPFPFDEQRIADRLQGPSLTHFFGTDALGRDLFSRILIGARMSLAVGVFTALFAFIVGSTAGALAGYLGGQVDRWIMRVVDFFLTFPSLLLAILFSVFIGKGFLGIILALGMTAWVTQARLVRAQVLQARELPYVEAAFALGLSHTRILFRHILPNLLGPILVSVSVQLPNHMMSESFLSFIGLGLQPPQTSWGTLAAEGFRGMKAYPHLILFPGGILFLTLLAFNQLGDSARDWVSVRD